MMDKKPLFETIAYELKQKISRGEYKSGMLMPSEKELQELFAISRTTIRRAIDLLVEEGLVIRKNGVGLYVRPKITPQNILEMTGVMKSSSAATKRDIKDFYMRKAGKFYAEKFGIKENELVYFIKFVQKSGRAHTLEILLLPLSLYPDLQAKDLQIISVLELVNSGKNELLELEQELQLITSNPDQMKYMQIDEVVPLFKLSTTYYAESKLPIAVGYRFEDATLVEYVVDFS